MRTPLTVMAVLVVGLYALWIITDDGAAGPGVAAPSPEPVPVIASRVEALRDLEFERVPEPVAVTSAQAREEGLEDLDRSYPEARRRADEEVYKLLALLEPGADLRELSGSLFGEGVAGYYDPRDGRLRTVKGAATGTRVLAEMVLAHELTHALEDQAFELDEGALAESDDGALAYAALVEGTATALMYAYVEEFFTSEEALGGLLGSAFADTGSLPPFLQATVTFPYVEGEAFASELLRRAGGRWDLLDTAFRFRPPASTEQVLHPRKYFDAEEPSPVRLDAARLLGDGWERAVAGTWGELQTRELLALAGGTGAADAAAGWGGDAYELWRARPFAGDACPAPCRAASVLLMRWAWDTRADAAEFDALLRAFAEARLAGSSHAIALDGDTITLAIAPSASLATRLARAS